MYTDSLKNRLIFACFAVDFRGECKLWLEQMQPLIENIERFSACIPVVLGSKERQVIQIMIGKTPSERHGTALGEIHVLIHPAIFDARFAAPPDSQKCQGIPVRPSG